MAILQERHWKGGKNERWKLEGKFNNVTTKKKFFTSIFSL